MDRSLIKNIVIGALAGFGLASAFQIAARRGRRYDLAGKVALITGGSRGLGLVLARELAARGCRVAICARDIHELHRAKDDLVFRGADVGAFVCDVTDEDAVLRLVAGVLEHFGRIDILINNAGIIQMGPIEMLTRQDFERQMDTHFWAPYNMMHAVLPSMIQNGSGRIANIASIGGKVPIPHLSAYCSSKFALVGLSSAVRPELLKYGVHVTTVCPGLMRTGSHVNAEFKGQTEKEYAFFSVVGTSPLTTVSAETAARKIVRAIRRGDAELVISPQAKLAVKLNNLLPEFTADILAISQRLLPSPEGSSISKVETRLESRSELAPAFLTTLGDAAAERNNELRPGERLD